MFYDKLLSQVAPLQITDIKFSRPSAMKMSLQVVNVVFNSQFLNQLKGKTEQSYRVLNSAMKKNNSNPLYNPKTLTVTYTELLSKCERVFVSHKSAET